MEKQDFGLLWTGRGMERNQRNSSRNLTGSHYHGKPALCDGTSMRCENSGIHGM